MGKFKDLTNDDIGNIVDWYDRGLYSQRELAEIFGVSRATVRRALDSALFLRETDDEVGQPTEEELGQYEELGQPNERFTDDVGHPEGLITWVALGMCLALALFTGYTIYRVMNP